MAFYLLGVEASSTVEQNKELSCGIIFPFLFTLPLPQIDVNGHIGSKL